MHLLKMKNISKSFSGIQVLFDMDIELKAGEIHCLVGENGAGKSTLVKILTGVYPDYTGEIFIEGKPCVMFSTLQSRNHGIFTVQQHRDLVPTMNAIENIFLGNYIYKGKSKNKIDKNAMRVKAIEYLNKFRVNFDLDAPVSQLKVSQQGIVAICKAIVSEGKILLIDEASAPLDCFERDVLYNLLKSLRDEGRGIIYISHHLEEIFQIGDRVTVLRNGSHVWTKNTVDTNRDDLIGAMTGNKALYQKDLTTLREPPDSSKEKPIIEYDNVSSKYVHDISFNVFKGEIIGFAGLEGSGKHHIAEMMFGLEQPISGSITYKQEKVNFSHPIHAIKKNIGFVPTDRKHQGLVPCRNIAENIILPTLNKCGKIVINKHWMLEKARVSVKALGVKAASINQLVEYLSGGNQQKVLIAKWIQAESEVLFLIEPTEGIDVGARADIYALLKNLSLAGKTMVVFSSDIDELITLSDRIFAMAHGSVVSEYNSTTMEKTKILSDILSSREKKGKAV